MESDRAGWELVPLPAPHLPLICSVFSFLSWTRVYLSPTPLQLGTSTTPGSPQPLHCLSPLPLPPAPRPLMELPLCPEVTLTSSLAHLKHSLTSGVSSPQPDCTPCSVSNAQIAFLGHSHRPHWTFPLGRQALFPCSRLREFGVGPHCWVPEPPSLRSLGHRAWGGSNSLSCLVIHSSVAVSCRARVPSPPVPSPTQAPTTGHFFTGGRLVCRPLSRECVKNQASRE